MFKAAALAPLIVMFAFNVYGRIINGSQNSLFYACKLLKNYWNTKPNWADTKCRFTQLV